MVASHGLGDPAEPRRRHLQRRDQLPAARDPAVHPRRRDHERVGHLAPADRVRVGAVRLDPRRPRARVDRRVDVLRRDLGLGGRRRRRARLDPHSRHEGQGLSGAARRGGDVVGGDARRDHPAVDPDDPLRGDGGDLGRAAVRRRHRAGHHRRLRPDGRWRTGSRAATTCRARRRSRGGACGTTAREALWAFLLPIIILGGIFGGVVTATEGAALAVVAALFVGLVIYRELDLAQLRAGDHRRRRADGDRHAAGRRPARCSAPTSPKCRRRRQLARAVSAITQNKWARAGAAQRAVPAPRHVPALGGRHHPGRAGRDAAGQGRSASIRCISA